jgi:hypothetical protein
MKRILTISLCFAVLLTGCRKTPSSNSANDSGDDRWSDFALSTTAMRVWFNKNSPNEFFKEIDVSNKDEVSLECRQVLALLARLNAMSKLEGGARSRPIHTIVCLNAAGETIDMFHSDYELRLCLHRHFNFLSDDDRKALCDFYESLEGNVSGTNGT